MPNQNYVVTAPDGGRQFFANVGNAPSFLKAMAASGRTARPATATELVEAGAVDGSGRAIKAFASFRVAQMGTASLTEDQSTPPPTHMFEGTRGRATGHSPAHAPVAAVPKAKDFSLMHAAVEETEAQAAGKKRPVAKKRSSLGDVMDTIQQRKR